MSDVNQTPETNILDLVFPSDNDMSDAEIYKIWEETSRPFAREVVVIPSGNTEPTALPASIDTEATPFPFKTRSDLAPTIVDRINYRLGKIAGMFIRL